MKKIAFVVVWSGKLPNYFPVWLESCKGNPTIDFYVFTDDETQYNYPFNVKSVYYSFEELKEKFCEIFPFEISLDKPYKFCDYKPAYGEAFSSFLVGYDFWGYCDIDLIWGNIREFLTDKVLEENERIFTRGHCSLFQNNAKVNSYYRTLPTQGHLDYKMVYQSDKSWCFDEWARHCGGGISVIFEENHIPTYDAPVMADIDVAHGNFHIHRRPDLICMSYFLYEDGNLFACKKEAGGKIEKESVLYCHFQKRNLNVISGCEREAFMLLPPGEVRAHSDRRGRLTRWFYVRKFDLIVFLKRIWSRIRAFT